MKYSAAPAVSLAGKPVTGSDVAAAAWTLIPDSVPVMLDVFMSVAVIDCVPAVLSVTVKRKRALIVGGEGGIGREARLGVGAGELDRAGVAGGHVAIGSKAVTVNVSDVPAVSVVGKPVTFSELAAAAWTRCCLVECVGRLAVDAVAVLVHVVAVPVLDVGADLQACRYRRRSGWGTRW